MRQQRKTVPSNAERPQHACFPSLAHESRGDRSLISDAKSQELRVAGRYYACTCQCLRVAIKYPSRTWNTECLQLRRTASIPALLWQTGLRMDRGGWDRCTHSPALAWGDRQRPEKAQCAVSVTAACRKRVGPVPKDARDAVYTSGGWGVPGCSLCCVRMDLIAPATLTGQDNHT